MKNLNFEKVAKENLEISIEVQKGIFPEENGSFNLRDSVDREFMKRTLGKSYRKSMDYWLCFQDKKDVVGITGIYSYFEYPNEAWCGWFGVLPEKRGHGYGRAIFLWTMEEAKKRGFKNFRLYTDLVENSVAVDLYRKIGMTEELYTAEDMGKEKVIIFSKSLVSEEVEGFGDKKLFLLEQEELQQKVIV